MCAWHSSTDGRSVILSMKRGDGEEDEDEEDEEETGLKKVSDFDDDA